MPRGAGHNEVMDVTAELDARCEPPALFAHVEDLSSYPDWLAVVPSVEVADRDEEDPGPAWSVELRGRVGPFARSKRLRMVRTEHEVPSRVVFERREVDGRRHAPWKLVASVRALDTGSRLSMSLHYGGSFGGTRLRQLLEEEIDAARVRLAALAEQRSAGGDGR